MYLISIIKGIIKNTHIKKGDLISWIIQKASDYITVWRY